MRPLSSTEGREELSLVAVLVNVYFLVLARYNQVPFGWHTISQLSVIHGQVHVYCAVSVMSRC